jgi:hypothetical protein
VLHKETTSKPAKNKMHKKGMVDIVKKKKKQVLVGCCLVRSTQTDSHDTSTENNKVNGKINKKEPKSSLGVA